MSTYLIQNATIINEGKSFIGSVLIDGAYIKKIYTQPESDFIREVPNNTVRIEAKGLYLIPGGIDDQVHFRDPGFPHKGSIHTESRAALAGGITSFMDMPNTNPSTLTLSLWEDKMEKANRDSFINYSFYMGAGNHNLDVLSKLDIKRVCGVKAFLGSSTGNLLLDDLKSKERLFAECPILLATHCEKEEIIRANTEFYRQKLGENIPFRFHPIIRNEEACVRSTEEAVRLAERYGTRLQVLHVSTAKELAEFAQASPTCEGKKITFEACVHYFYFNDTDYDRMGALIKCNPAIKTPKDQHALHEALASGKIDMVATDHAPHTKDEKSNPYFQAPSGLPLIQHSLVALFDLTKRNVLTVEQAVERISHAPARAFNIYRRGFIRENYYADIVLLDPSSPWKVEDSNILYHCGWSPFLGHSFEHQVKHCFVNGVLAYSQGSEPKKTQAQALHFER